MRRPLTALSAAFALALSLAPAVQGSAASTCAAPNGSQFRVSSRDLAAPSAQATCQARLALQKHAVVTAIAARPGISAYTDYQGTSVHFTMSNYRLNDINTGGDWYLFATQLQTAPAYGGCNYSSCGPWTIQRNVRIPGPAPLSLADYGPTGTITSSTTGYTVGAGLSAGTDVGVGVSASYSQTWDQPSVVTYDQTSYATATAAWQENFGGPSYYWWPAGPTAPPSTSTNSFQSDQAAIFKAPE